MLFCAGFAVLLPLQAGAADGRDEPGASDAAQLDRVVVTAAGFEQTLADAPASISVISREELETRRFSNIAEAVADVPGVDVRASTGKTGGQEISIRGMPSDYTLILIDGRPQNASGSVTPNGFGSTSTGFMPPMAAIERIEVIRGPMSTLYGSAAMGGVVNIITRPVGDRWTGSVATERTFQQERDAGNSSTLNLFASGPLVTDRLGVQLRGRLYDRDASERLIQGSTGRDPRPPEARIYSIGGRLAYTPDATNEFWFDAERARQVYSNDNCRLGTLDETDRATCEPSPGSFWGYDDTLRFHRDQLALGHSAALSFGSLQSSLTHNQTETLGRTLPAGSAPAYGYEADGGEPRTLDGRDITFDTKLVAPLGSHTISVGGRYSDGRIEDGAAGDAVFEQQSWALFAEDEWWLLTDVALTVGGRYENHDAFGGQFSPRAYLAWNMSSAWTLKGGVSRGYKAPSLNDLHDGITGFSGQGTTVSIGSPTLQPEESTNYELGAVYAGAQGTSLSATVFYNRFTDRIASAAGIPNCQFEDDAGNRPNKGEPGCLSIGDFTVQETFEQLMNIDEAQTRGLELSARMPLGSAWTIAGGYTFTDTEITSGTDDGLALTNAPDHKLTASLRWDVTARWQLALDGEHYSSRERFAGGVPTSGQNASLVAQLGNELDAYHLFNLRSSYRLSEGVRLSATIYNLLDRDFGDADAYQHEGDTYLAPRYTQTGRSTSGVYLDRRSLWLAAQYDF